MKKQLTERLQELAGIKPVNEYTFGSKAKIKKLWDKMQKLLDQNSGVFGAIPPDTISALDTYIKALKEDNFDARMQAAGNFSDEEMDDITSRDPGSPFPGTDEVSNGYKAAQALKDELREITYKKLSQEEIDTFSKEMVLHFLDNTTAAAAAKIHFGKKRI